MYKLNIWRTNPFSVAVIGCGGTGGFVAEGLCRFVPEAMRIVLVDHDRVEERNICRQNFYAGDVGRYKSEVLAQRLSNKFSRSVGYITAPVSELEFLPTIMIGCVDNGQARADIARIITEKHSGPSFYAGWYIDSGNGENYGQVLIGNRPLENMDKEAFETAEEICYSLPLPSIQRPDILLEIAPQVSCAEAVSQDQQSPTINQTMAGLVIDVVHKIINHKCSWMQLYIDMQTGTLRPTMATPENVASLLHMAVKKLTWNDKRKMKELGCHAAIRIN